MSKEFIEKRHGSQSIDVATRQQNQLSYFLTSIVQEDVRIDYYEKFIDRKYFTNDVFLDWVKSVFKTDNWISFVKYYRNPNPASKLINTRIKEPLSRVFFSEDAYFYYLINGQHVEQPKELEDGFEQKLFDAVIFRHNDIIIHDLKDINTPYRKFISIDKVTSIEVYDDCIQKIAYTGEVTINGEVHKGYVYLDSDKYEFYDKDLIRLISQPHDYGQCPATFVVADCFGNDPVVKTSIFSYLRSDLEEYSFLKTLQRMVNANGALPIVTKLKTKEINESGDDFEGAKGEPMSSTQIGSKVAKEGRSNVGANKGSVLQAGTIIEVPAIEKEDGSIDMELTKNFLQFHYMPVEALKYLEDKIKELEATIITSSIGDYSEGNEGSMNEKQIQKTFVSKEDKLRWLSNTMSISRRASDNMMLSLKYGKGSIKADVFYGSDFFWETPEKLYEMFSKSPNSIERTNLLIRLSKRRNMFNKEKSNKEVILYKLMPYSSDIDFKTAIDGKMVDELNFEFQTRFPYWIAMFESYYGNIVTFWNELKASDSIKIVHLNNLIFNLIKTNKNGKEASS